MNRTETIRTKQLVETDIIVFDGTHFGIEKLEQHVWGASVTVCSLDDYATVRDLEVDNAHTFAVMVPRDVEAFS